LHSACPRRGAPIVNSSASDVAAMHHTREPCPCLSAVAPAPAQCASDGLHTPWSDAPHTSGVLSLGGSFSTWRLSACLSARNADVGGADPAHGSAGCGSGVHQYERRHQRLPARVSTSSCHTPNSSITDAVQIVHSSSRYQSAMQHSPAHVPAHGTCVCRSWTAVRGRRGGGVHNGRRAAAARPLDARSRRPALEL
jgi:hypothetical protein